VELISGLKEENSILACEGDSDAGGILNVAIVGRLEVLLLGAIDCEIEFVGTRLEEGEKVDIEGN